MMLQAGLQNKKYEIFDILTMVERPVQFSAGRFACFIGNSSVFPMKQNAPQDAHLAERKSSLRDPLGRERVASDSFYTHILLLRTDCNYTKIELLGKCKNSRAELVTVRSTRG